MNGLLKTFFKDDLLKSAFRIAIRNLRRRALRTFLTMTIIVFGTFLLLFGLGLTNDKVDQFIRLTVANGVGSVVLEGRGYEDDPSPRIFVEGVKRRIATLRKDKRVRYVRSWIFSNGTAQSPYGMAPAKLEGVDPAAERAWGSAIPGKIITGAYLKKGDEHELILGFRLAKRLKLKVGHRVVITVTDSRGSLRQELFLVRGIFRSGASALDNTLMQFDLAGARRLLRMPSNSVTRLGVLLKDERFTRGVLKKAKLQNDDIDVLSWQEVLPGIVLLSELNEVIFSIMVIFFGLLILGLVYNTLSMAVSERRSEFTIALCIGASPSFVRLQVFLETIFLVLGGLLLGILLSLVVAAFVNAAGGINTMPGSRELSLGEVVFDPHLKVVLGFKDYLFVGGWLGGAMLLFSTIPLFQSARVDLTNRS